MNIHKSEGMLGAAGRTHVRAPMDSPQTEVVGKCCRRARRARRRSGKS